MSPTETRKRNAGERYFSSNFGIYAKSIIILKMEGFNNNKIFSWNFPRTGVEVGYKMDGGTVKIIFL